jgi:hypothetical protein
MFRSGPKTELITGAARECASQENRKGTAKTAIVLLGDLRSVRSVPLLVEYLSFGVFYKETKRVQTREDYFPAVRALIRIGNPSVEPVLKRAEGTDDATVLQNAALVIKGVLQNGAAGFMEMRGSDESDPRARQRQLTMEQFIQKWNRSESRSQESNNPPFKIAITAEKSTIVAGADVLVDVSLTNLESER